MRADMGEGKRNVEVLGGMLNHSRLFKGRGRSENWLFCAEVIYPIGKIRRQKAVRQRCFNTALASGDEKSKERYHSWRI